MSPHPKLTKRIVETAIADSKDYVLWDEELPGFGLRIFPTGKRSYPIQYRADGRSRRYTIGIHGIWTPETARREAKMQLDRVAQDDDPAEERAEDSAFGVLPNQWNEIFIGSPPEGITPPILRRSFASIGRDLGFTEVTIAALLGHAKGLVTSKYIHVLDATLIVAADTLAGYISALLEGTVFRQRAYALDRNSRQTALNEFLARQQSPQADGRLARPEALRLTDSSQIGGPHGSLSGRL